ncbi:hypothetical protein [Pseudoalteromonas sp. T1lg22]|uniref:hypothetical protein n=1 Tax=Pseudoalteromonas sp. T1lg22 TaxID=2077096 RepID=UPI000CF634A3|nr:hypothetical protein [Pseudoalteromonas sp. T1lg22]
MLATTTAPTYAELMINQIKQRVHMVNRQLRNEELCVYESGTQYCVIVLLNTKTRTAVATFGVNAAARRDLCLTKAFLSLVENTRKAPMALAA